MNYIGFSIRAWRWKVASFISLSLWSVVRHWATASSLWDAWQFCPFMEQSSVSWKDMLEIASHCYLKNWLIFRAFLRVHKLMVLAVANLKGKQPARAVCTGREALPIRVLRADINAPRSYSVQLWGGYESSQNELALPGSVSPRDRLIKHTPAHSLTHPQHTIHPHLSDCLIISILLKTTCFLRAEPTLNFLPPKSPVSDTITQKPPEL